MGIGSPCCGWAWIQTLIVKVRMRVLSCFSHFWLFVILWPVLSLLWESPLSMRVSRQEHWSGLPCPPPGDLPDPEIESASLGSPALAGELFTISTTGKPKSWAWLSKYEVNSLSHVWLLVIPWTVAYQAPLSTGFSRQEYWSGLPLPSPSMDSQYLYCISSRVSPWNMCLEDQATSSSGRNRLWPGTNISCSPH